MVQIKPLTIRDPVSNLVVTIREGKDANSIEIETLSQSRPVLKIRNRSFWFSISGKYTGTGHKVGGGEL